MPEFTWLNLSHYCLEMLLMSLFALCYGGDFWILSMAFLKGGESSEGWDGVRWCSSVCYHKKVIISGCQWNFTAVSSIGGSIKLCSTLFFWKAAETGIWCGTGSFHCKRHGMFLSIALFLSVDGRKEWWAKHGGKEKKKRQLKQASHHFF